MSAPSFATPLSATPLPAPLSGPVRVGWRRGHPDAGLIGKEWLITNGLGGYASGTLAGIPTRRYHGPLVASLSAPHGRTLMLNHLVETLHLADGTTLPLSAIDPVPSAEAPGPVLPPALVLFQLVNGRPSWRFDSGDLTLEKSLLMPHGQNTVLIRYRLSAARAPVRLALEPLLDMRPHDSAVGGDVASYRIAEVADGFEIAPPDPSLPPLRLRVEGGTATIAAGDGDVELRYRLEQARGYDWRGTLRSAGTLVVTLEPGAEIRLIASTEAWEQVKALPATEVHTLDEERRLRLITQAQPELRSGLGAELAAELLLAADQFIIKPHARPRDEAVLNAQGDTACTVIAGYPWFTDWGRDTMISLEGLTLLTGRLAEARDILHTFAHHVRDGLIPNLFPEGQSEGLYHTADATLWFFHAVDRYEAASGDLETRRFLLPKMAEIIEKHIAGTRFGIGVDPADGLLRQGAPGYQLTWMDAKVGDWVVTPRRGKAVEINALFYNALCLMQRWLTEAEKDGWAAERGIALRAADVAVRAAALQASFNRRFWYADGGYLYDVVDGEGNDGAGPRDDASLRPNQVLAISLPYPVLEPQRWSAVLDVVAQKLATPFGLRSLAPGHPDYKPRYDGDLRARDAAYHQGTVWGWLVGPFVEAWLKVHPADTAGAARLLGGLEEQLGKSCIGTISEICDAEPPFAPRGCMAQAWSVAEALRALYLIQTHK
jgi:predicted glycogen debranching enzyme